MRAKVDTLEYITGGVLSMRYEDNKQKLVAFISKLLNEAEKNYKFMTKKYWQSSDAQRNRGTCQKKHKTNLRFKATTKI